MKATSLFLAYNVLKSKKMKLKSKNPIVKRLYLSLRYLKYKDLYQDNIYFKYQDLYQDIISFKDVLSTS